MSISVQQLGIQVPAETNMHTIEKRCFQCGLCRVVIKKITGATSSAELLMGG
jgi:ferredoxin-like protein FixX